MSAWATVRRVSSVGYWTGLSAERARAVRLIAAVAATLAAAKVLLSTIGVALFVAEEGAGRLPVFYLVFAPLAILLSLGLASIIDRAGKVRLAQVVFGVLFSLTLALRLLPALGLPGTGFALLAAATAFEIVLEILLWVVAASYLDASELRRATPLVYTGLTLGGALGGIVVFAATAVLAVVDLLVLLLPLGLLLIVQLRTIARRLVEVPDSEPEEAAPAIGMRGLGRTAMLLRRYPLALLIALNALVVTLLYGLAEYLILTLYEERFASEAELAGFLSLLFALMQILEFALLLTLARALLERGGPLLRNLAFPISSLGTIGSLLIDPKLATAVAAHVNIEALSNALFLPVNNTNYGALPLALQGRARTLSEGIFYPLGLALAGLILWPAASGGVPLGAEFATLVFVLILLLVSSGIGLLVVPTLMAEVQVERAGPAAPARAPAGNAPPLARVQALLGSREVAACLFGLQLARHLDLRTLEPELRRAAGRPDRSVRTALAHLIAEAPDPFRRAYLDHCLSAPSAETAKLGLLVLLLRPVMAAPVRLHHLAEHREPALGLLVRLARDGADADLGPEVDEPRVQAQLIEAVVSAGRGDLADLVLGRAAEAAPDQVRHALALTRRAGTSGARRAQAAARRLICHRSAAVRAEALAILGGSGRSGSVLRPLAAALDDPDERVRRTAANALAARGDRGAALLRRALRAVTPATADAAGPLARIDSPRARRLLVRTLSAWRDDAERTSWMLDLVHAERAGRPRLALEITLLDHRRQLIRVALEVALAALDPPLGRQVARALEGADQRPRAKAFELLAARLAGTRLAGALDLLRALRLDEASSWGRSPGRASVERAALRRAAAASRSPWVRLAGGGRARPIRPKRARDAGQPEEEDRVAGEQTFERLIVLKRTPLFRDLAIDSLVPLAAAVRATSWLKGDQVVAPGSTRRALLVLESGRLAIDGREVVAPACFGDVTLAGETMPWPRIEALEDSSVGILDGLVFDELVRDHPVLIHQLCRHLARRLRHLESATPAPELTTVLPSPS